MMGIFLQQMMLGMMNVNVLESQLIAKGSPMVRTYRELHAMIMIR